MRPDMSKVIVERPFRSGYRGRPWYPPLYVDPADGLLKAARRAEKAKPIPGQACPDRRSAIGKRRLSCAELRRHRLADQPAA